VKTETLLQQNLYNLLAYGHEFPCHLGKLLWLVVTRSPCNFYLCCNWNRWIAGRVLICMWYWFTGRLSH